MGQTVNLQFHSDNPTHPVRPAVTVNGRLAEIIYKLLLAASDITEQPAVKVTINCQGPNVSIEVPKRY